MVGTTVLEKAIAHSVESRPLEIPRHKVVSAGNRASIALKLTYAQEGKNLRRKAGGYAHAKKFKCQRTAVKRQRTIFGVVVRAIQRMHDASVALRATTCGGRCKRSPVSAWAGSFAPLVPWSCVRSACC